MQVSARRDIVRRMHTTPPSGWDAPALADALQRLKDHGLNNTQIAEYAKVSRSQVSRWVSGGHRPSYDALVKLSDNLMFVRWSHPAADQVRQALHDLFVAAGYHQAPSAQARDDELMVSPYSGQVWRIVRSLERRAEDAGLTEEEEREMIERAMENAERQAEMMFDADLSRREREQERGG